LIKLGDFVSRGQYRQVSGMNVGFFTDCSDVDGAPRFTNGGGARRRPLPSSRAPIHRLMGDG
jgi:hypothetical protein